MFTMHWRCLKHLEFHNGACNAIHTGASIEIHTGASNAIHTGANHEIHTGARNTIYTGASNVINTGARNEIHTGPSNEIWYKFYVVAAKTRRRRTRTTSSSSSTRREVLPDKDPVWIRAKRLWKTDTSILDSKNNRKSMSTHILMTSLKQRK